MSTIHRSLVVALSFAGTSSAFSDVGYLDAIEDLFDNGVANLDITSVGVSNTATHMTITVQTRAYADWTKYMIFMNTGAPDQSTGNGWNRPMDYDGQTIDRFLGSWVDAASDNAQLWSYNGAWNLDAVVSADLSQIGSNMVSWTFSLEWLGLGIGDSLLFDVGTSGGGELDTSIDLLSRDDMATDWWTTPAVSGEFLKYVLVPSPGAFALLGIAGLMARRRRD